MSRQFIGNIYHNMARCAAFVSYVRVAVCKGCVNECAVP